MSPESIESFFALAIGFALAGVLATGYQLATYRPAGFHLLERGPGLAAFAAVPFLAFAAPFIIMRNTLRGHELEGRSVNLVLAATVISGFWSLMSGSVVVMALASLEALRM
jgi:hypothetical protein